MTAVLSHLQQYVQTKSEGEEIVDPDDGEVLLCANYFHYILFGGDQLTAEIAIGEKRSIDNEIWPLDRLQGLIPVIEDWQSKFLFFESK